MLLSDNRPSRTCTYQARENSALLRMLDSIKCKRDSIHRNQSMSTWIPKSVQSLQARTPSRTSRSWNQRILPSSTLRRRISRWWARMSCLISAWQVCGLTTRRLCGIETEKKERTSSTLLPIVKLPPKSMAHQTKPQKRQDIQRSNQPRNRLLSSTWWMELSKDQFAWQ